MLKVDFHTHTADDPADRIPYTTHALIERAAEHGYDALAITLHDAQLGTTLRDLAEPHAHIFDAVEVNAMFTRAIDFNARARAFAAAHRLPLVGNGDIHRLEQLDTTYSLVDAARNAADICAAVIAGRVRVEARPLTMTKAVRIMTDLVVTSVVPRRNSRRSPDTPALSGS